jgi:hypothetical protein
MKKNLALVLLLGTSTVNFGMMRTPQHKVSSWTSRYLYNKFYAPRRTYSEKGSEKGFVLQSYQPPKKSKEYEEKLAYYRPLIRERDSLQRESWQLSDDVDRLKWQLQNAGDRLHRTDLQHKWYDRFLPAKAQKYFENRRREIAVRDMYEAQESLNRLRPRANKVRARYNDFKDAVEKLGLGEE